MRLKNPPLETPNFTSSPIESAMLAEWVRDYWRERGYLNVKTWVARNGKDELPTYSVRSNLVNGLPPRG